jgi:ribonuclease HII
VRIAGVDEAGRGCLAGPVVAAAVILDPKKPIAGLNDSKKLTAIARDRLRLVIERDALAFAVASASVEEIDTLNILRAALLAMQRAVIALSILPDEAWIDGNFAPQVSVRCKTFVGGDALHSCISAASILAKTHRDEMMVALDAAHPRYGFAQHKAYGTALHLRALTLHGPLVGIHRFSFAPVRNAQPLLV